MEDTKMKIAHDKAIKALIELLAVWEEDQVVSYPKYLPSFDEFIAEFCEMLDTE